MGTALRARECAALFDRVSRQAYLVWVKSEPGALNL